MFSRAFVPRARRWAVPFAALLALLSPGAAASQEPEADADSAAREDAGEVRLRVGPGRYILRKDLDAVALAEPRQVAPGLRVTHAGVGIFRPDREGGFHFVPSDRVPAKAGELFGWVVRFDTSLDQLEASETFTLPVSGKWNVNPDITTISADGRSATTPWNTVRLWDWLFNTWGFEEGDPRGPHRFIIRTGDDVIAELSFTIE